MAALSLAACTTGSLAPEGADYVQIVELGLGDLPVTATIYANDALRREFPTADGNQSRTRWSMLPEGSYREARAILQRSVPCADTCAEVGAIRIISASVPVKGRTMLRFGCGADDFDPMMAELQALLPPWRHGNANGQTS